MKFNDNRIVELEEFEIHETGGTTTTHIKDFFLGGASDDTSDDSDEIIIVAGAQDQTISQDQPVAQEQLVTRPTIEVSDTRIQNETRYEEQVPIEDLRDYDGARKAITRNIYFKFDGHSVRDNSLPVLNTILKLMQDNPNLQIEIAGHTDNIGSKSTNKKVSQRRAQAVMNWLVKNGIDSGRLTAKGYGENIPLATNDDEYEGRELNRRIEIIVR